jgi:putative protease
VAANLLRRVRQEGNIVEASITSPISYDKIKEQVSKLGDTPFKINNISIDMDDNIFISIKEINELRRSIINELIEKRRNINYDHPINDLTQDNINIIKTKTINILVRNEDQLKAAIDMHMDNIYVVDASLYYKYKDNNHIYYRIPRVVLKHNDYQNTNLLVSELGGINKFPHNNNVVSDSYLNIVNSKSALFFHGLGVKMITLSPELDFERIKLLPSKLNLELIIYGRIELMIMKYCPLNMLVNKGEKPCSICHNHQYALKNKDNYSYPIITNNCLTYIMHHKNIDLMDNLKDYQRIGISNYRLELFDENYEQTINLIERLKKEVN